MPVSCWGCVPVDGANDRPRVREIEPRIHIEVPHQIGFRVVLRLVAIAWPHAQRHRRRDTPIAALDARAAIHVSEVLDVDLPCSGQAVRHAEHERARLGVDAGTVVLAPVRAGDHEDAKGRSAVGSLPFLSSGFMCSSAGSVILHSLMARSYSVRDLPLQRVDRPYIQWSRDEAVRYTRDGTMNINSMTCCSRSVLA